MTITMYTYNGEPLAIDKSGKTAIGTAITIDPLSTIDLLNPVFVISYDSSALGCKYVVCSDLGRAYFATPSLDTAGRIILTCSVDYMSSFNLSSCPLNVVRNGGIGAPTMIPDTKLPINPNAKDIIKTSLNNNIFTKSESYCYLLTVIA